MKKGLLLLVWVLAGQQAFAQKDSATVIFDKLRSRLDAVKDYVADVRVKIDVSYMKVPPLNGKLYYKAPDKMKLERDGGISILPKKMSVSHSTVCSPGDRLPLSMRDGRRWMVKK